MTNKGLSDSNDVTMSQKHLDKILKLQQDQEKSRQEEYQLLKEHLAQMNILLAEMIKVNETGSTVAATKKTIPFHTGSETAGQLNTAPSNPDGYPTIINIYSQNDSRPIQHMTLVNDGPGEIFFIVAHSKIDFSTKEAHLNVNDQRELFNVFEVRLRSNLPLTTFRLIEGIFRTGSFAPATKANTEIRPTIQPNEKLKAFVLSADFTPPIVPIVPPVPAVYLGPSFHAPIAPGVTLQLTDIETFLNMPYIVPQGFILETFSTLTTFTTPWTLRGYYELAPTTGVYNLAFTLPSVARSDIQWLLNVNIISSQVVDPFGAPAGGRGILFTITNDDLANNMIGEIDIIMILRQLI